MPDEVYFLNEQDRKYLKQALRKVDRLIEGTRRTSGDGTDSVDSASPEVYIARPVMENQIIAPMKGMKPSETECHVFRLDRENSEDPWELRPVLLPDEENKTLKVYNASPTSLLYGFHLIKRTKYGRWMFENLPAEIVKFELLSNLDLCGEASAVVVLDDLNTGDIDCTYGAEFTVVDTIGIANTHGEGNDKYSQRGAMGFARALDNLSEEELEDAEDQQPIPRFEAISIGLGGCCDDSESDSESDSDSDSDSDTCIRIPGVDFEMLETVEINSMDQVLIVRDGCLKLGRVGPCRTDDSE